MSSYLLVPAFIAADNIGGQATGGLPDVLNPSARFCAHPRAGREWTTNPQHAAPRLYHAGYSTLAPLFLVASILDWLWLSQSSPSLYPITLPFSLPSFLVIGFVGSILYFPPQLARCQAASRWARHHLLSSATDSRRFAASAMAICWKLTSWWIRLESNQLPYVALSLAFHNATYPYGSRCRIRTAPHVPKTRMLHITPHPLNKASFYKNE